MSSPRKAWLAALLSVLTPGLGQLYAGRPKAAVAVAVAAQAASWSALTLCVFLPPGAATAVFLVLVPIAALLGSALHAAVIAHRLGSAYELRPYNRWYGYLAALVILLMWQVTASSLGRKKVAQAFRIPSTTMEPTLLVGDYVYVAKLPRSLLTPQRGAIVVFVSIEASTPGLNIVKRVLGTPGDTLLMVRDTVYRNGKRLDEPYALHLTATSADDPDRLRQIRGWQLDHYVGPDPTRYRPTTHDWGPIVVPPQRCFVMGDNRDESYDSRYYGFVPFDHIRGRPRLVYFSYDRDSGVVRWKRIGRAIL